MYYNRSLDSSLKATPHAFHVSRVKVEASNLSGVFILVKLILMEEAHERELQNWSYLCRQGGSIFESILCSLIFFIFIYE